MSDFLKVANELGIPWAIVVALGISIAFLYRSTVPRHVYDREVERTDRWSEVFDRLSLGIEKLLERTKARP